MANSSNPFRNLPSVNQLLENPRLKALVDHANHNKVVTNVRTFLDQMRSQIAQAAEDVPIPSPQELADRIASWITKEDRPTLRPVVNATGVILHTGLGRAPMAEEAMQEVAKMATGYASLEVELDNGKRSQRDLSVRQLLCELTGAASATVVNNNAAATMLALTGMAKGAEVIVSRGQLVEIGGSFRLPDVMTCAGAILREVGTTNKTRLSDYEQAINENTGAILRVHPSNYRVVGFTDSVDLPDLVALGKRNNLPVIDDVGSGALIDFAQFGLHDEPLVSQSVKEGADIVLFSGDKLVGGPQCGILVGSTHWVDTLRRNPMTRAMRVDKMTLAGLAATLRLYRDPKQAAQSIPLLRMLSAPLDNLRLRAERLAPQIGESVRISNAEVVEGQSTLGGGTLPSQFLPSWCVALTPKDRSVDQLAHEMRMGATAVFGRIYNERLFLDLRTVDPKHDIDVVDAFVSPKSVEA